jgi:MbtH protein
LTEETHGQQFQVVVNHEEQYSIWPVGREQAPGWREEGFSGSREACLERIAAIWTDMRPLSLRRSMEEESAKVGSDQ